MLLTESTIVTAPLSAAILLTSPYIVWVAARWMGSSSSRWRDANRWAPIILVVTIGALGWYVDHNKNHFFTCSRLRSYGRLQTIELCRLTVAVEGSTRNASDRARERG